VHKKAAKPAHTTTCLSQSAPQSKRSTPDLIRERRSVAQYYSSVESSEGKAARWASAGISRHYGSASARSSASVSEVIISPPFVGQIGQRLLGSAAFRSSTSCTLLGTRLPVVRSFPGSEVTRAEADKPQLVEVPPTTSSTSSSVRQPFGCPPTSLVCQSGRGSIQVLPKKHASAPIASSRIICKMVVLRTHRTVCLPDLLHIYPRRGLM
jgi:hypothetical protein